MAEKIERVPTGVAGVDRLIGGGLPAGSIFLVAGGPGTGKTIFALHFASAGVERGEVVVYVCMEQEIEDVKKQAQQLGIDVSRAIFVSAQKLQYGMGKKPEDMDEVIKLMLETVASYKPVRIVVDPINSLGLEGGLKSRLLTKKLVDGIRKTKATTILVGEAIDGSYADTVTPYTADGIALLTATEMGTETTRNIIIKKLRLSEIAGGAHEIRFTKKGMEVL